MNNAKILQAAGLTLTLMLLHGCASAPPPNYTCPGTVDGFLPNDATSAEVEHCLGKPDEDQKGDGGRYTYIYHFKDGVGAAFLFSSAGRLISVTNPDTSNP